MCDAFQTKIHASENPSLRIHVLSGNTDGYRRQDVKTNISVLFAAFLMFSMTLIQCRRRKKNKIIIISMQGRPVPGHRFQDCRCEARPLALCDAGDMGEARTQEAAQQSSERRLGTGSSINRLGDEDAEDGNGQTSVPSLDEVVRQGLTEAQQEDVVAHVFRLLAGGSRPPTPLPRPRTGPQNQSFKANLNLLNEKQALPG